ncbi:serine/threonine protein kinase [Dolichospermum sp. ST_con]|nr:serine/threonine protein kinase [Dolichospermum sp. ST_con]MDD1422009.1 serine/threonine protein kinase [Dolichospermum sp. ST_sed1]MDD1427671.1 serine/threonine protein kinase [Dolichospermum sp. ST_sed9]MDD1433251.1 serine/threonine protein kinase [Dolichospermum sp. ST_sed6]MDD1443333.1 serine/threonine protein kinase [Dolichospermum sp. ST_sed3]MDD1457298.1 serine/threonine protein kinase [Dolichospermum sp. ST_sed7]MDD1463054.1 serine/threonine protein kinase [Dolichospermum sp. ST_se
MIKPGDMINNRYHVLQELGDGAFGKTFTIEDRLRNDQKVIKILNLTIPKALELFKQECNVLQQLNHSGIPQVAMDGYVEFRCFHTQEILHGIVMEKIEGQDLNRWLDNNKITNTEQAITWLEQLIDILGHVHQHNYCHRDIKPSNIMLKPDGELVLIDFGIVKEFTQQTQRQNTPATIIGSPGYNSPEQERGTSINYTSDFFSLGRTFVNLLTGIYPGNGELNIDSRTSKLLWRDQVPGISEKFKDLIDDLMEYEPRNRPKSTKEILKRIKLIDDPVASFPPYIVYLSFVLNLVLLTLLAMRFTLNIGFKILFMVIILVIADFLFLHKIQSLFKR